MEIHHETRRRWHQHTGIKGAMLGFLSFFFAFEVSGLVLIWPDLVFALPDIIHHLVLFALISFGFACCCGVVGVIVGVMVEIIVTMPQAATYGVFLGMALTCGLVLLELVWPRGQEKTVNDFLPLLAFPFLGAALTAMLAFRRKMMHLQVHPLTTGPPTGKGPESDARQPKAPPVQEQSGEDNPS
jgi:hypothetical protein